MGIREATIDFPVPALPHIKRPCIPAAATSAARRSTPCPFISLKSTKSPSQDLSFSSSSVSSFCPVLFQSGLASVWTSSFSERIPMICIPFMSLPSLSFSPGRIHCLNPPALAASVWTRTPCTGFTLPSSPSSPITRHSPSPPVSKTPKAPNTATAMGRSKAVPPFFTPAGDKFTVIFLAGS